MPNSRCPKRLSGASAIGCSQHSLNSSQPGLVDSMDPQIALLYRIEDIEARVHGAPFPEAEQMVNQLESMITDLTPALREQYEWLRSWTRYPIARLRQGTCTGCGATYNEDHAFLRASSSQVTYCEHCLRILLLNDLVLVA